MKKKCFGFHFLVGDVISGVGSTTMPFWLRLPGPGPQLLDGIFGSSCY